MVRLQRFLFALGVAVAVHSAGMPWLAAAQTGLPATSEPEVSAKDEDFDTLMEDAQILMLQKRPIDARAKLQKAVQLRPGDYHPHMMLGQYYLFDVGQFKLAYRYILTAQELFMKQFGKPDGSVETDHAREHITLLYLRSEAELNLDKYEDSLKTLDVFGGLYWSDWYPGTRAWVLMKLKRVDEAINVAQSAAIGETDRRRVYNVLGILLSIRGQRELSLRAFQQAIAEESALGSLGQVATPLNNAGEVYRELFRDNLAEASWLRAIRLPDGCDHILPSLNLSILYTDEARFLLAERALSDFEACFAQQNLERQDTEHRGLIALARGKIRLRMGQLDESLKQLSAALERQQWFGKIGTNENDVQFASLIALSQALRAEQAEIRDKDYDSLREKAEAYAMLPSLAIRTWWTERQARDLGVNGLEDLEDLSIRNTDTMLEYPTVGSVFTGFPVRSFKRRIDRMLESDSRPEAAKYYKLYLAQNLWAHGDATEAERIIREIRGQFRPIDRLAQATALGTLIEVLERGASWFHRTTTAEADELVRLREELYGLLPSELRYRDLSLPVRVSTSGPRNDLATAIHAHLRRRLSDPPGAATLKPRYELQILTQDAGSEGGAVTLQLVDTSNGQLRASQTGTVKADWTGRAELINSFLTRVFSHKIDPPGEPVPRLELLEGIM